MADEIGTNLVNSSKSDAFIVFSTWKSSDQGLGFFLKLFISIFWMISHISGPELINSDLKFKEAAFKQKINVLKIIPDPDH